MSLRDLAFAARTLRKSPVFALTAALTIALGVGASTAIFSVTNAVLLRPLPYQNPDQLVIIPTDMRNRGVKDFPFSNANFIDLREATKGEFQGLAGVFTFPFTMTGEDGMPEQVHMGFVTTNYFQLVGAGIAFGRDFSDDDGQPQPPPPAPGTQSATPPQRLPIMAILSNEYFQRRFGSNPAVLGQSLNKGKPFSPRIVGVLAPHFEIYFPPSADLEAAPDIWVANRLGYSAEQRNSVSMHVIGRLKPGVTIGRAQAAADQVAAEARKNFSIENTAGYAIRVEPMRQHLVSEVRPAILALMGAVIFLLLIACANVANLLLVRASLRQRELAIRSAIGASWWDLARQILSEALLLATIGALGGLGIAWLGIHELLAIAPAHLPRLDTIRIDSTVLIFTVISSLVAAAIFGLAPAWRAARPDVMIVLRGTSRSEGLASGGLSRKVVVCLEVALAYVLLIGSGLMVRSFRELQRIDPGFNPRGVLTFAVSMSPSYGQNASDSRVTLRELEQRLLNIPGVQAASVTGGALPMTGDNEFPFWVDGRPKPANVSEMSPSLFYMVAPGYQQAMQIPLKQGRFFSPDDNEHSANVVVIDESFAREYFPKQNPIGQRIHIGILDTTPEVIGVVGHVKQWGLDQDGDAKHPIHAQAYMPFLQIPDKFFSGPLSVEVVIRSQAPPATMAGPVREAIQKMNSENVMYETKSMEEIVAESLAARRFSMILLSVFAALALLLSSIGIYGVLSYVVGQRSREIGIRIALGAQRADVLRLMLGEGMKMALVGVAIGIVAALALTRLMVQMLFGVSATDPLTFVGVAAVLAGVALAACYIPARRAMRVDPIVALRYE